MNLRLNCDMGESFGIWKMGNDEELMPYVDMANLACGFHASDSLNMNKSVLLSKKYDITIGAHPSYQDLVGFGRRSILCSLEEIKSIVLYQLGALQSFCKAHGTTISYVKPHGALYTDMMRDENILKAVLNAISSFDKNIKLMIISGPKNEAYKHTAMFYGITLLFEVFVNRNYTDDGVLVSKIQNNAFILDELEIAQRIVTLKEKGFILSINNQRLFLEVDTIFISQIQRDYLSLVKLVRKHLY